MPVYPIYLGLRVNVWGETREEALTSAREAGIDLVLDGDTFVYTVVDSWAMDEEAQLAPLAVPDLAEPMEVANEIDWGRRIDWRARIPIFVEAPEHPPTDDFNT